MRGLWSGGAAANSLLALLLLALATATTACDGNASEADAGADGETGNAAAVTSSDGLVTLTIPDGALPDGVSSDDVRITPNDTPSTLVLDATADELLAEGFSLDAAVEDAAPPALSYRLEPSGTTFNEPLIATFRLEAGVLDRGGRFTLTSEGRVESLTIADVRMPTPEVVEVDVEVPHFSEMNAWGVGERQVRADLVSPEPGTVFTVGSSFHDEVKVTRTPGAEFLHVVLNANAEPRGVAIERVHSGEWRVPSDADVFEALGPNDVPMPSPVVTSEPEASVRIGPIRCEREGRGPQVIFARPRGPHEYIYVPYDASGGLGEPEAPVRSPVDVLLRIDSTVQCVAAGECGDGTASGTEECDGADLRGETCGSMGLVGTLACDAACKYTGCSEPSTLEPGPRDTLAAPEAITFLPHGFPGGSSPPGICVAGENGFMVQDLAGTILHDRTTTDPGPFYEVAPLSARTSSGDVVDDLWAVGPNGGFAVFFDPMAAEFRLFGLNFLIAQNLTDITPVPHATEAARTAGAIVTSNSTGEIWEIAFNGSTFELGAAPLLSGAALTEATGSVVSAVRRSAESLLVATDGSPGHLFWYDEVEGMATLVGELGNGPRRVRCAAGGNPCFASSYLSGEVVAIRGADPSVAPTLGPSVSVNGPIGIDIASYGDAHVAVATSYYDDLAQFIVLSGDGTMEEHSIALGGCTAPGHAAWLGEAVADGLAVSCNGNDRWVVIPDVPGSW